MPRRARLDEHRLVSTHNIGADYGDYPPYRWYCSCGSYSTAARHNLRQAREGYERHYERMREQGLVVRTTAPNGMFEINLRYLDGSVLNIWTRLITWQAWNSAGNVTRPIIVREKVAELIDDCVMSVVDPDWDAMRIDVTWRQSQSGVDTTPHEPLNHAKTLVEEALAWERAETEATASLAAGTVSGATGVGFQPDSVINYNQIAETMPDRMRRILHEMHNGGPEDELD